VAFAHERRNILHDSCNALRRRAFDKNVVEVFFAQDTVHGGIERHENHIVLIAKARCPFERKNANDAEPNVIDLNFFPDGVFFGKKIVDHRLAEETNPCLGLIFVLRVKPTIVGVGVTHRFVNRQRAGDLGVGVFISIDDLDAALYITIDVDDIGIGPCDGLGIFQG